MTSKSGLKLDKCTPAEFRDFMTEEWEYGVKRAFTGQEASFSLRPPARAFGVVKRTKGATDNFQLSGYVMAGLDPPHPQIRGSLGTDGFAETKRCHQGILCADVQRSEEADQ